MSKTNTKEEWKADLYLKHASFVYSDPYAGPILGLLNAQPGEKILDLGCGTGHLGKKIQDVVGEDGFLVAMDISQSMVATARANGIKQTFIADAQDFTYPKDLPYGEEFDAVFSNALLQWCRRDPAGAIRSVAKVLRKDGQGRFVVEMAGFLSGIGIRSALHAALTARGKNAAALDPNFLPTAEEYQKMLEDQGFEVKHISLTPRITPLEGNVVDWISPWARPTWLKDFDDEEADEILHEVQDRYALEGRSSDGRWGFVTVRLRAVAFLKASSTA